MKQKDNNVLTKEMTSISGTNGNVPTTAKHDRNELRNIFGAFQIIRDTF